MKHWWGASQAGTDSSTQGSICCILSSPWPHSCLWRGNSCPFPSPFGEWDKNSARSWRRLEHVAPSLISLLSSRSFLCWGLCPLGGQAESRSCGPNKSKLPLKLETGLSCLWLEVCPRFSPRNNSYLVCEESLRNGLWVISDFFPLNPHFTYKWLSCGILGTQLVQ